MPLRNTYDTQSCSIARALELLGERWTLLIVRDAFHGLTRFDEFHRSLGCATNVLSTRLQKLVDAGVLQRDGARGPYTLTRKGRDLHPVLLTLIAWADEHEPGPEGPEVVIEHASCGGPAGAVLHCASCGEELEARDLRMAAGDGGELTPPQLAAWGGR